MRRGELDVDQPEPARRVRHRASHRPVPRQSTVTLINRGRAIGFHEHDGVGHRPVTLHPRRTARHPGYRQPARLRPLGEQAFDLARGDMPFDRVAVDDRGVAAAERVGDAVAGPVRFRIRDIDRLHTEAVGAQMLDPRAAAASGGVLVNHHRLRGVRGAGRQQSRSRQDQDKLPSLHVVLSFKTGADRHKIGSDCSPAGSPAAASIHAFARVHFLTVRMLTAGNSVCLIHIKHNREYPVHFVPIPASGLLRVSDVIERLSLNCFPYFLSLPQSSSSRA